MQKFCAFAVTYATRAAALRMLSPMQEVETNRGHTEVPMIKAIILGCAICAGAGGTRGYEAASAGRRDAASLPWFQRN